MSIPIFPLCGSLSPQQIEYLTAQYTTAKNKVLSELDSESNSHCLHTVFAPTSLAFVCSSICNCFCSVVTLPPNCPSDSGRQILDLCWVGGYTVSLRKKWFPHWTPHCAWQEVTAWLTDHGSSSVLVGTWKTCSTFLNELLTSSTVPCGGILYAIILSPFFDSYTDIRLVRVPLTPLFLMITTDLYVYILHWLYPSHFLYKLNPPA